ncbi:hypothetical protein AOXY_G8825 [Acipenser oxyrinchus oxyrinchus]|uniref:Ig-like domain-containing protein n=1 Tax=Acipenser oxyrinchus oxyrinchus TaxID=40147 RepID=A0AAD8LN48_ACIOX|nr:hypothetical protein AOXY_G8825 [Acipenser oxyrinchus oxyrinchus]
MVTTGGLLVVPALTAQINFCAAGPPRAWGRIGMSRCCPTIYSIQTFFLVKIQLYENMTEKRMLSKLYCKGITLSLIIWSCLFVADSTVLKQEPISIIADVGTIVTLQCNNESLRETTQATWTKETQSKPEIILSYKKAGNEMYRPNNTEQRTSLLHVPENLFSLRISQLQHSDAGNYTCITTTSNGVWKRHWELITKDPVTQPVNIVIIISIVFASTAVILCGILTCICKKQLLCLKTENKRETENRQVQTGSQSDYYVNSLTLKSNNSQQRQMYLHR